MDENLKSQLERVRRHTILEVLHGSHAYGMNTPSSDEDVKGVCLIPDPRLFFGMQNFEQQDQGWKEAGEGDKVVYHLPKFLKLAGECNPNIIELLFIDKPEHIRKMTEAGRRLRNNRQLFLSKRARHTFTGYAHAQLLRIKAHKRWLDYRSHPARDWVRNLHGKIAHEIPERWRICGENLYAKHSIGYDALPSYFLLFSVWNERNECLSWEETEEWAALLGLETVPVLWTGSWSQEVWKDWRPPRTREGYVIRLAGSFHYREFRKVVGKYVRADHVQTHAHWMHEQVERNGLAKEAKRA